jgi:hypothetical protein
MDQLRNGTPTKLREFSKVAQQANLVARMGFWQVYAYVVVGVDAREQNAGRNTYEGSAPASMFAWPRMRKPPHQSRLPSEA